MSTSQNGWLANNRSVIASYSIPGGKIAVRKGDVATVLVYVAKRFHSEVEPLRWPGNWGYAERPIRGSSTTLSNHASGTAIDLNAPRHPLGKRGTFSKRQVAAIRKILADTGGVIRWGGNYRNRKDEMHFEINAGSARVREVAKAIRAGKKPGPSGGATVVSGGGGSSYGNANAKHEVGSRIMRKYSAGTDVEWLQKRLYKLGYKITPKSDGTFDRMFGPEVDKAVRAVQSKAKIAVDGDVGKDTIAALKDAKPVRDLPTVKKPKKKTAVGGGPYYAFPYKEKGAYIGPKSGPDRSHSGIGGRKTNGVLDSTLNKRLVNQLVSRGWNAKKGGTYLTKSGNDGKWGPEFAELIKAFQRDQGLAVDGLAGRDVWIAAFENPIK